MRRLRLLLATSAVLIACNGGGSTRVEPVTDTMSTGTMTTETVSTDAVSTDAGATDNAVSVDEAMAAAAAAAAQRFIDEGDNLGPCPFDPDYVAAVISKWLPLSSGFLGPMEDDGQVFYGGDVDIVYCQVRGDTGGEAGPGEVTDLRIDVHPGTADIATYLDEEWGELVDLTTDPVEGGSLSSGCLDDLRCVAMWQGNGLFIALMVETTSAATGQMAVDGLLAVIPAVADNLVNGR